MVAILCIWLQRQKATSSVNRPACVLGEGIFVPSQQRWCPPFSTLNYPSSPWVLLSPATLIVLLIHALLFVHLLTPRTPSSYAY